MGLPTAAQNLIIGLSPMDGITDGAFRYIATKYGKPDLTITEFVHVIGICRGGERLWQDFIFSDLERPIYAQIFGTEPDYFYHAAKIAAELGFDGVDINMGCPARTVAERGAGAGLIQQPQLAQEIVRSVRRGIKDWFETGELTGIKDSFKQRVIDMVQVRRQRAEQDQTIFKRYSSGAERSLIPVTAKTRVGFNEITISEWIKQLSEAEPDRISLHGRTFKQMYTGQANWDAIAEGVSNTHIPVLANGDIKDFNDIYTVISHTGAAGVLIGRATYGNPWLMRNIDLLKQNWGKVTDYNQFIYRPSMAERVSVLLEHVDLHTKLKDEGAFVQLRKHMGWYATDFPGAVELRQQLVRSNSLAEVKQALAYHNL
jgi:tRNA-dihydrouridine synthase